MPDQSMQSVTVAAQPAEIMSVISDFASYSEWAEALTHCEVLSHYPDGSPAQVRFVVDAGMIQDDYVLAYDWAESQLRVDWDLVSSRLMKSQTGSYVLTPQGRQTEVTYALAVELDAPMLAMFRRQAEKAIMDVALRSLKKRVEGGR
jgi:ribosome-associated toxin RatA of RatAB toxin-antitoxin module